MGREYGQQHEKTQVKQKIHDQQQSKQKRRDLLRLQETIFSLSPLLLKNYADLLEDETEAPEPLPDAEGNDIDDSIDLETDLEVDDEDEFTDEDDFSVGEGQQSPAAPDYGILLGDALTCKESAVFLPNTVYTITVAPLDNGQYRCRFEGPSWFNRRLPGQMQIFVNKLRNVLAAIAQWLEDEKQIFLQEPIPEKFVHGEIRFPFDPVVQQEGFLARINKILPEVFQVDKSAFSRLLDNIWLVWPEWNMPLKNIFTKEFSHAWLVEVSAEFYKEAEETWLQDTLQYPDFGAADLKLIKKQVVDKTTKSIIRQAFDKLSPEDKLHLLRDKVGCDIGTVQLVLQGVITKIRTLKQDNQ